MYPRRLRIHHGRRLVVRPVLYQQQVLTPVVQTTLIEDHVQQPRDFLDTIVEWHIQHQPQIIHQEEVEHVYMPDPVQHIEHRTYIHQGSSTIEYRQGYSEAPSRIASQNVKYVKDESEDSAYDTNDSRKGYRKRKDKTKRRDRDIDKEGRKGSYNKSRRYRSRSRSRSRSRDRDTDARKSSRHRESSRRDVVHESSTKQTRKASTREHKVNTRGDADTNDRSDANKEKHQVPRPSARMIEDKAQPSNTHSKKANASSSFDPYEIFGFQDKREKTDQINIEITYKALRKKWHPDRHMRGSKEEQDEATKRMSEINQAYDIIGNPKRRAVFDRTGITELWELDGLVECDEKDGSTVLRPGDKGKAVDKKPKGLKNIFRKS